MRTLSSSATENLLPSAKIDLEGCFSSLAHPPSNVVPSKKPSKLNSTTYVKPSYLGRPS